MAGIFSRPVSAVCLHLEAGADVRESESRVTGCQQKCPKKQEIPVQTEKNESASIGWLDCLVSTFNHGVVGSSPTALTNSVLSSPDT
jgi:hypothetical protein